jgi:WD40 repeat protein
MAGLALRSNKFLLKFSVKHHVGCVHQVAVCDKYIASCGSDERLFLFTAKDRGGQVSDLGSLAPASEARCIAWHGNQYLVCGCADGTVAIYRSRDWESLLALPVHQKAVNAIAVHPSGAIAVTVGADRNLAVLDMIAAKLITREKLKGKDEPLGVLYNAAASRFLIFTAYDVTVFDTRTVTQVAHFAVERRPANEIHCVCFVSETAICIGSENGTISRIDNVMDPACPLTALALVGVPAEIIDAQKTISDETKKKHPTKHATRVKCLVFRGDTLISADANGALIASRFGAGSELMYRCSANCQGRITSVDLIERPS